MFDPIGKLREFLVMSQITADTQAKIAKAFADKDAAAVADVALTDAEADLAHAQQLAQAAHDDDLSAHRQSSASAHDALAALAADLNIPLPS